MAITYLERVPLLISGLMSGSRVRHRPRPNPSVEARPNGKSPCPPPGCAYHPSGGQGASPSAPPHLERYPTSRIRADINFMKQSFYILLVTGVFAIAATFLAWVWGGKQEDASCAIGGVAGFLLANGAAFRIRSSKVSGESYSENVFECESPVLEFAYGVFAIIYFAFVGWLSGYLHDHGELAGTVCGGLGGYILAVSVPAIHRSLFLSAGRAFQLALCVIALGGILAIVYVMYKHEFL